MPDNKTLSGRIRSTTDGDKAWQQERSMLEATERLCQLMEEKKVTRSDLAFRLNKSKSHVSQLLNGEANMTIRTLSDLFFVMGRALHVSDGALSEGHDCAGVVKIYDQTVKWTRSINAASTVTAHPAKGMEWKNILVFQRDAGRTHGKEKDKVAAKA